MSKVLWLCVYDEMEERHCDSCIEKAMRFEELKSWGVFGSEVEKLEEILAFLES